jgi:hypothetical protein
MTQSNVTTAVARKSATREETKDWLATTLGPLFVVPRATFVFNGVLSVYGATADVRTTPERG